MRPFLKWAGNKYQIIQQLQAVLPYGKRLVEPFVGSGAVFLNTHYSRNLLNDANLDIIQLYQILKTDSQDFIRYCRRFFNGEMNNSDNFYQLRQRFNQCHDPWQRSALFIYLNRHAFNGLCRYNLSGHFNVPFGRFAKPYFPEKEMHFFAEKAQHAQFAQQDFLTIMRRAKLGDIVYCDPPYVPLSKTANFTAYHSKGFGYTQQVTLAKQAEKLACKGIPVIISNHDQPLTRQLYANAELVCIEVKRNISCKPEQRGKVKELIAVFSN